MGAAKARSRRVARAVRTWLGRTGTLGFRFGSVAPTVAGRPYVPLHLLLAGGLTAVGALVIRNAMGLVLLLAIPFSAALGQSLWSFLIVVSAVGSLAGHGVAQLIEPSRFPFSDDIERW